MTWNLLTAEFSKSSHIKETFRRFPGGKFPFRLKSHRIYQWHVSQKPKSHVPPQGRQPECVVVEAAQRNRDCVMDDPWSRAKGAKGLCA